MALSSGRSRCNGRKQAAASCDQRGCVARLPPLTWKQLCWWAAAWIDSAHPAGCSTRLAVADDPPHLHTPYPLCLQAATCCPPTSNTAWSRLPQVFAAGRCTLPLPQQGRLAGCAGGGEGLPAPRAASRLMRTRHLLLHASPLPSLLCQSITATCREPPTTLWRWSLPPSAPPEPPSPPSRWARLAPGPAAGSMYLLRPAVPGHRASGSCAAVRAEGESRSPPAAACRASARATPATGAQLAGPCPLATWLRPVW